MLPILHLPPGMTGDLGPGTLDLSLPSDDALMATARPNPERAYDQVRTGRPDHITALADRFTRAGASMDESYDHSEATQRQLATAFTNDGAPVYDRETHFAALPRDYRDAGTRQHDIARRLTVTADGLRTTQTLAADTVTTLRGGLHKQRVAWAGEVAAARNPAGLIPYAAIPGLTARRATIAAGMQNDTNTAGTTIAAAIGTYEDHLHGVRRLLGDAGHGGDATVDIPGPPPEPTPDAGAGAYNSDPWWTRFDDVLFKQAALSAADGAEAIGWTDAARHLRHYLSGSGEDLTIDPSSMMRDAPGFRSDVDGTVRTEIGTVSQQAIDSGTFGTAIPFRSDWKGYYIKPDESQNWFYANGGIQYSTSGTVTVQPPSEPGGQPHVSVDYKVHVWDRYNWDGGKSTQFGPITVTDEQMAALHRAGLAREYDTTGSTDILHYDGPQPASSPPGPVLSPSDNRDGQRSDPTRDRQSLGN